MRARLDRSLSRRGVSLAVLVLIGGCVGSATPGVQRDLSTLSPDPIKANEELAASSARPTAENRKGLSRRARRLETVAATGAAIIGSLFSTSKTTLSGVQWSIDENRTAPIPPIKPRAKSSGEPDGAGPPPPDPTTLVPWVHFWNRTNPAPVGTGETSK